MREVAVWLDQLGMSEYAQRFAENDIDMGVLGELTDADFDRLGVSIGHRRKLLKALAVGSATIDSAERPQIIAGSTSWLAPVDTADSPMSNGLSPAEIIGGRALPRPQVPVLWSTASDDPDAGLQVAHSGEAYIGDDQDDIQSPRWRDRLVIAITVIALAGLGSAGAFAYRAVFPETASPTLPSIIKTQNGPSKDVQNYSDAGAPNSSQTSRTTDPGEKFVRRWPADNQELTKTASISAAAGFRFAAAEVSVRPAPSAPPDPAPAAKSTPAQAIDTEEEWISLSSPRYHIEQRQRRRSNSQEKARE
jgi:hypothetical protein